VPVSTTVHPLRVGMPFACAVGFCKSQPGDIGMDGIKAKIQGDGIDSSVEFSVEEVMSQHRGKPWREMSDEERTAELKDYAVALYTRQGGAGTAEDLTVTFDEGTFSRDRSFPQAEGRRPSP
jgi:hypothetical protein